MTLTSTTNTFTNILNGVTVEARRVLGSDIVITVDENVEKMQAAVETVVSAYNAIVDVIAQQNEVDSKTNRGGPLIGDSALTSLQRALAQTATGSFPNSGSLTTLDQIGMRVNREGKLEIDADTLVEKLAGSIDDVTALFSGVDSFADQLRRAADCFVDPLNDQGMLVARIAGTNESIADIDESIAAAEERLETLEANLIREFAALEQTLSRIRSQGDFLGQFLLASRSR